MVRLLKLTLLNLWLGVPAEVSNTLPALALKVPKLRSKVPSTIRFDGAVKVELAAD